MSFRISRIQTGTPGEDDWLLLSQLSSITISASTISAAASDNSLNDSGLGFVAAGFVDEMSVQVEGFTGAPGNNYDSATIETVTAGKMIIKSDRTIADDAAGETVTITAWRTRRVQVSDVLALVTASVELRGLAFTSDTGSTSDSDPGAGLFKWDNATQGSATYLYFDDVTIDAVNLDTFYGSLGSSGFIYMQQSDDEAKWQLWKWTSSPTDGTGYWKFPVTLQASGGSIVDAKTVYCDFAGSGSGGAGTVTSVDASGGVQTASGSAITATGTVRGAFVINAQTGTTYAVASTDRGKHVTLSNAASIAATIAQAGTAGFEDGYFCWLECIGAGAVTLTPTTSTVNGASTLVLTSGMSAVLFSDGANYRAIVFGAPDVTVNAQTGTTYTYLSGDRGKLVTHSNGSSIAGTLPQATGAFGAGWSMWVENRGAGTLTITPTTSTIDGASSLALTTNQGALIVSDGTNYYTMRGTVGSAATLAAYAQGDGLTVDLCGFRGVPQNAQSGNYTLVAADAGKHIYHASGAGSGDTYTIPANGSVAYPVGTTITFANLDSNAVSIAITTDTLYLAGTGTTGTRSLAQYGVATALKTTSTTWVISGTGLS